MLNTKNNMGNEFNMKYNIDLIDIETKRIVYSYYSDFLPQVGDIILHRKDEQFTIHSRIIKPHMDNLQCQVIMLMGNINMYV